MWKASFTSSVSLFANIIWDVYTMLPWKLGYKSAGAGWKPVLILEYHCMCWEVKSIILWFFYYQLCQASAPEVDWRLWVSKINGSLFMKIKILASFTCLLFSRIEKGNNKFLGLRIRLGAVFWWRAAYIFYGFYQFILLYSLCYERFDDFSVA